MCEDGGDGSTGSFADWLQALLGEEGSCAEAGSVGRTGQGREGLSQPLWGKRESYRKVKGLLCSDKFLNEIGKVCGHLLEVMPFSSGTGQE